MNNLYVVPTPIGNLSDFTDRSKEVLKSVKYILCEDTKVTGKIKKLLELDTKLISLHKFNELSRVEEVKRLLEEGDIALVSDAGTPTISDPGQILISELKDIVNIIPLPGCNAITTALSGSGLIFSSFTFVGFLPKEEKKIVSIIEENVNSDVIVCYESPNRINKTLLYIEENIGDIRVSVARELTKIYEDILTDNVSNLKDNTFKGEIVLMIETKDIKTETDLEKNVNHLIDLKLREKDIINYLVSTNQFRKNEVYNYIKRKKEDNE